MFNIENAAHLYTHTHFHPPTYNKCILCTQGRMTISIAGWFAGLYHSIYLEFKIKYPSPEDWKCLHQIFSSTPPLRFNWEDLQSYETNIIKMKLVLKCFSLQNYKFIFTKYLVLSIFQNISTFSFIPWKKGLFWIHLHMADLE